MHGRISLKNMVFSRSGTDPGFLERGFICINVWGFASPSLHHFLDFLKISYENEIIWSH